MPPLATITGRSCSPTEAQRTVATRLTSGKVCTSRTSQAARSSSGETDVDLRGAEHRVVGRHARSTSQMQAYNANYVGGDIVTGAMKVFAKDAAIVSIDSDLATTSGLEAGVASVDQRRALNVQGSGRFHRRLFQNGSYKRSATASNSPGSTAATP